MELTPLMVLIGLILPALIGLVTRLLKDSDARFWASTLVCAIVASLVNVVEHDGIYTGMTLSSIVYSMAGSTVGLMGLVKLSYEGLWNNTAISKLLPDQMAKDTETPLKALGLKPAGEK